MRITLTYNLRTEDDESQGERFDQDYVDRLESALLELDHEVTLLESTMPTDRLVDEIVDSKPDLVFNLAEGTEGKYREALLPTILTFLKIPYTGGPPELLAIGLDKRLTERLLERSGVPVPRGRVFTTKDMTIPDHLEPPYMVKPNFEGSSMGIHEDSIIDDREAAEQRVKELLEDYPEGVQVEEFIPGREITVPFLAAHEDRLLEPVEYTVPESRHNIVSYETKSADDPESKIVTHCPADLTPAEREEVMQVAARAFSVMRTPDFGRADLRLREDGKAFLIEVNPMPGLRPVSPLMRSAEAMGMRYVEVIDHIIRSACIRQDIHAIDHHRHRERPEARHR
ncbi:MAG: ATP-grasp domain-containing protein [Euryarchaeota archaeon]|nr:ATP-grasp domain-containing protein [Euryarchaeota archaeon]